MDPVYERLREWGLSRQWIKTTVLPSWWDDDLASTPDGLSEGLLVLSRHLGVTIASLRDPSASLVQEDATAARFKVRGQVADEAIRVARTLSLQIAALAAVAAPRSVTPMPTTGREIRNCILDRDRKWVDLEGLVDYCWDAGIPVLHLTFPAGIRKMEGLSARVGGRPVIILTKNERQPALLAFVVAHELGHILSGHIDDGVVIDSKVEHASGDEGETEANLVAVEILTGSRDTHVTASDRWLDARRLAAAAREYGEIHRVDPGHVAMNYAKSMGAKQGSNFMPVGRAALNLLEPNCDAMAVLRRKAAERLDWTKLPASSSEYLINMTGVTPKDDARVLR
jgi:hypothetical protein